MIAHKSSSKEILDLRKLFDQYDTANNGIISFEEFRAALKKANYPEEQVTEIFKSIVSVASTRSHDMVPRCLLIVAFSKMPICLF
jgi:Ca2+-binding EF-hand superfamily protein